MDKIFRNSRHRSHKTNRLLSKKKNAEFLEIKNKRVKIKKIIQTEKLNIRNNMTKIHYIKLKLSREIFTKYNVKFKGKLRVIDNSLGSKIYVIGVL